MFDISIILIFRNTLAFDKMIASYHSTGSDDLNFLIDLWIFLVFRSVTTATMAMPDAPHYDLSNQHDSHQCSGLQSQITGSIKRALWP